MQPDKLLLGVSAIVREVGPMILPFFQSPVSHHLKSDSSPVTEADVVSHGFLVEALEKLGTGLPVISEESSGNETTSHSAGGECWLVDPLDGTKEFLKGKPEFTVNVALITQHRPVLGVVHAPALGLTYQAEIGKGAWRQSGREAATQIHTRQAVLSRLTVVASKDHSGPGVKRLLQKLPNPGVTSIGSSLKFCLIAEGKADLYFRDLPTMEWDTAAAQCVLEAAGGQVLDLRGDSMRYGKPALRNPGFVAVGDAGFQWKEVLGGNENKQAFRSFFDEMSDKMSGDLPAI